MLPVAIARPSWPATLRSLRSLTRLAVAALILAAGLGTPASAAAPADALATPIVAPVRADALVTPVVPPVPAAVHGPAATPRPGDRADAGAGTPDAALLRPAFAPAAAVATATGDPMGARLVPTTAPGPADARRGPTTGGPAASWHLVVVPPALPAAGVHARGPHPSAPVVSPVDPGRSTFGRRGPPHR
ncbi:hypothetical protein AB0H57_05030 [Micromonospora sp. NPDC050686]|uniref:hypothetical protein n=1 Tax=Micromonospora sp. NPDC050686 TaxID=3154631 RepID=UPI0034061DC7